MDDNLKILLEAGRMMRTLLARDPAGVEMATAIYTETEAEAAIAAWVKADAAIDPTALALHGFDSTDFGPKGWPAVCQDVGLVFHGRAPHPKYTDGNTCGWAWRNVLTGLLVVTSQNPDTGEHYLAEQDAIYRGAGEDGFAGYMGLEGPAAAVAQAVTAIRKHATYVKASEAGRRSYI